MTKLLSFEKPIKEIQEKIDDLRLLTKENNIDFSDEIEIMEKRSKALKTKIYKNLKASQILQIARHIERPGFDDYTKLVFSDFLELHGDRLFGDDKAIGGGLAFLDKMPVMVIGHKKGKDTKTNIQRNFGMAQPEGYRKALRLMNLAERLNRPIITLIDTPGAYPGRGSEERGIAEAIARNLQEMVNLKVPIISIIMGEGGSGGALGIAIGNKIAMLEHSVYSVISPEGCASILYRDASKIEEALNNLKICAKDLLKIGIIDEIITEPIGGAHNDHHKMASNLKKYLLQELGKLKKINAKQLSKQRYEKFINMGIYSEK